MLANTQKAAEQLFEKVKEAEGNQCGGVKCDWQRFTLLAWSTSDAERMEKIADITEEAEIEVDERRSAKFLKTSKDDLEAAVLSYGRMRK